jgi:hypothetical protein
MIRKSLFVVATLFTLAGPALANDDYHVYKLPNGECEIDTRGHQAMKDQRSGVCLGHFSNRTDAEKQRKSAVSSGQCKCPSGQNC